MKNNLVTNLLLIVSVVLLGANLVLQVGRSSPSYGEMAAQFQYKVIPTDTFVSAGIAENSLDRLGQEGWELSLITPNGWMIFKRKSN